MRLDGPAVASPRTAGRYLIGVPMWMWVTPSPATFGPTSASATAGGVTVTATAKVTQVRWTMGDGTTVTCGGPGTPYQARFKAEMSPTCGHRYTKTGEHQGHAVATWTVEWTAAALGDNGSFTETRQNAFIAHVDELQAVDTS
ncbi:ATP/GTP-binding protein [Streptomyces sp. NPDC087908]|uniref:ATP/GTP-binding protein n=1 Tax=Streptomyces sp. NPDC087908 TaxID=3365820 RepID=UPI0038211CEC